MSIYGNNSTALSEIDVPEIPLAEGYDCSFGAALGLVESARSDMAMFEAMMKIESQEAMMRSNGTLTESALSQMSEAAGENIFKKACDILKKLVGMIKSSIASMLVKLQGLFNSDKNLIEKYQKKLIENPAAYNDVKIKWRQIKKSPIEDAIIAGKNNFEYENAVKHWSGDTSEREKYYGGCTIDEMDKVLNDTYFGDLGETTIGDIGGINKILDYLKNGNRRIANFARKINSFTKELEKEVASWDGYNKDANKIAKESIKGNTGFSPDSANNVALAAQHAYDMVSTYKAVTLKKMYCIQNALKTEYKQYKAAFVKMVGASVNTEATLLDAIVEAAEAEVDDVISTALNNETISDVSQADTAVVGSDVSDDPNKNVYDKTDCYTQHTEVGDEKVDGEISTNVNSKDETSSTDKADSKDETESKDKEENPKDEAESKNEAAMFNFVIL